MYLGRASADTLEDILGYFALLQHHSDKKNNRFGYLIFRDFAANEWILYVPPGQVLLPALVCVDLARRLHVRPTATLGVFLQTVYRYG